MKSIHRWSLAILVALGLMMPALSQTAVAGSHSNSTGQKRIYWVYYRATPNNSWVCYGGYWDHGKAVQAVMYFRNLGYDSFHR